MFLIKEKLLNRKITLFFFCMLWVSLLSCVNTRKIRYFKDISDTTHGSSIPMAAFKDPVIQTDDILSISILTIDPQTSLVINQLSSGMPTVGSSSAAGIGGQQTTGYLVDKDSMVELSMMGKIKLAGLTTFEARDLIREKASVYFKNSTVSVRYANFKITVLGEVARPAVYIVPNEKVTLLDALGLAGDLTIYGKRNNVLLMRDIDGKKQFERFNLNSADIIKSPYFYLKQNDVIYVEPNYAKAATLNVARTQTFALIGTILTVIVVLFTRVK